MRVLNISTALFLIFAMFIYVFIWHRELAEYSTGIHTKEYRMDMKLMTNENSSPGQTKIIYIWNRQPWLFSNFGSTRNEFKEAGCSVHNCRLVDRFSYPDTDIAKADCILFTIRDYFDMYEKPQRTSVGQIWVIWHREAPLHNHPVNFVDMNDYFNLTYTHMDIPGTDIYSPLGRIIPRQDKSRYNPPDPNYIRNKTGLIAWIVSNCNSKGQREEYVQELSKYVKVDIYGKCGMNCSREGDVCFKKISREYKFYMAAESMYCEEYITEKMFRPLSGHIVPIAIGGAHYSSVLPKHSYIDVRDFKSPKHLAKYIKYLDSNEDKYTEYFSWKHNYTGKNAEPSGMCRLCEILHSPNYPYKSGFKFDEYWDPGKYCKVGKAEKLALHI